jgi:hypothetical protein
MSSSYTINIDFNNEMILYFGHLYDALNCLAWHQYWNFCKKISFFKNLHGFNIYTIGKFESFSFILTWYDIILNAFTWFHTYKKKSLIKHMWHMFSYYKKLMNNTMFLSQFQYLWRFPWAWNNQNKYISKGHEPTMTKTCLM